MITVTSNGSRELTRRARVIARAETVWPLRVIEIDFCSALRRGLGVSSSISSLTSRETETSVSSEETDDKLLAMTTTGSRGSRRNMTKAG